MGSILLEDPKSLRKAVSISDKSLANCTWFPKCHFPKAVFGRRHIDHPYTGEPIIILYLRSYLHIIHGIYNNIKFFPKGIVKERFILGTYLQLEGFRVELGVH